VTRGKEGRRSQIADLEMERHFLRSGELRLRAEIITRRLKPGDLAKLMDVQPIRAEMILDQQIGTWELRTCLRVAEALELRLKIEVLPYPSSRN